MTTIDAESWECPLGIAEHSASVWQQQLKWRRMQTRRFVDKLNFRAAWETGLGIIKGRSKRFYRRHRLFFSIILLWMFYLVVYMVSFAISAWLTSISPWLGLMYLVFVIVMAVWFISHL